MSSLLSIVLLAAAAAVQPRPATPKLQSSLIEPLAIIQGFTATPATITFTATNPATAPSVPGNVPAVASWVYNGIGGRSWNLTVGGGSTTFAGCLTVPISAVTVTCTSASLSGTGGTGACSAPLALSTTARQVASGTESNNTVTYTVNLALTLADSWRYIATSGQTCSLTLTYNLTLN